MFAGLIGVCGQPGVQRLDEHPEGVAAAREGPTTGEQRPGMVGVESEDQERAEVLDVLGHEETTGAPGAVPEVGVIHPAQLGVVDHGKDVMATPPQLGGDRWREHLIEEQAWRHAMSSRAVCQAFSAASESSSAVCICRSISSWYRA